MEYYQQLPYLDKKVELAYPLLRLQSILTIGLFKLWPITLSSLTQSHNKKPH